ncbi:MAG TPA: triose-phosphate isomerase [Patescibacteria group bacterium]|nr:triose-phosphate isomerase [Patescibacteria group bacterium]
MKKLIAGNWKMNGTLAGARTLAEEIAAGVSPGGVLATRCDFVLCPPFVHLQAVGDILRRQDTPVLLGAQDCARTANGAFTGDISAAMLKDIGCHYVILGHSERRSYHKEADEIVAAKAAKAHEAGLITIICVGENEGERNAGHETDIVGGQLIQSLPKGATSVNTVIAYEPVWAIGTGKTAKPEDVRIMHKFIREKLKERLEDFQNMRILYGGSVKPDNAESLFAVPNVDGGLIGGASLKTSDYLGIAGGVTKQAA